MHMLDVPLRRVIQFQAGEPPEHRGEDNVEFCVRQVDAHARAGALAEGKEIALQMVLFCGGVDPSLGDKCVWVVE